MVQPPVTSWLRIQCPKCEKRYRVDRNAIPPQGVTIRCRQCNTQMLLRRKPQEVTPPQQKQILPVEKCPKCGFDQKQGEFCYRCGARIRQTPPKPSVSSEAPKNIPMALLNLIIEYQPAAFFMSMFKPVVEIDGETYHRNWGKEQFQLPPGKYNIKIYGLFFGKRLYERLQIIHVEKDDFVELKYTIYSTGRIIFRVVKKESNASWRALLQKPATASTTSDNDPWYLKPYTVISALLSFPPLGVYLLWKSKSFADSHKLIIAVVSVLGYIWMVTHIKLPSFS